MNELICTNCKGRRFRKISAYEYECEYCGAINREIVTMVAPQVSIANDFTPEVLPSPFPVELSFEACYIEGFDTYTGQLLIYPDKFRFEPGSNPMNLINFNNRPREWKINDIVGFNKGFMGIFNIKMKNGRKLHFSVYGKERIINLLEERRKYWANNK